MKEQFKVSVWYFHSMLIKTSELPYTIYNRWQFTKYIQYANTNSTKYQTRGSLLHVLIFCLLCTKLELRGLKNEAKRRMHINIQQEDGFPLWQMPTYPLWQKKSQLCRKCYAIRNGNFALPVLLNETFQARKQHKSENNKGNELKVINYLYFLLWGSL